MKPQSNGIQRGNQWLRECPLCGGINVKYANHNGMVIVCSDCYLVLNRDIFERNLPPRVSLQKAWNRRPNLTP